MKRILQQAASRICRFMYVSALYETRVGIKCTNQLISSETFDLLAGDGVFTVPAEELCLWIDGMKDEYTLLDTPIIDSPHFELVKTIRDGGDVLGTRYLERMIAGTLDLRPPHKVDERYIRHLEESFGRGMESMKAGGCEPLKVARIDGRHYIADGKHRAALLALEGAPAKCQDVTVLIYDSFFRWMHRRMLGRPDCYRKHINHFELTMKRS